MSNEYSTAAEWLSKVVDVSDNSTTVYDGPALLRKIYVNTTLSAHTCAIDNDTGTTLITLPASMAAGSDPDYGDMRFDSSLVVTPNASGTGSITVIYKPYYDGLAGPGYSGADGGL